MRECLKFTGKSVRPGVLVAYDTCRPETTPPLQPYFPPPKAWRPYLRAWKKIRKWLVAHSAVAAMAMALVAVVVVCGRSQQSRRIRDKHD